MEYVKLTKENLAKQHICCAISNESDVQVSGKKAWLRDRLDDGLVFLKADVRGKCFIEYLPAEKAWAPVTADGYTYIDCLWVSGQFKGQGAGAELLKRCIEDSKAQGKKGIVIISSKVKRGFLSDRSFLEHFGFECVDSAPPYFLLYCLSFTDGEKPRFISCEREKALAQMNVGYTIQYTAQCPFTAKYVPLLAEVAREKGVAFTAIKLETAKEAQNAPCAFTTFALYYRGEKADKAEFVTHEIQSEKKFAAMIDGNK